MIKIGKALKLFIVGFMVFAVIITLGFSLDADAKSIIVIAFFASICFTALFSILCKKELEEESNIIPPSKDGGF